MILSSVAAGGLPGATAASRYVGATISGAPVSGTFSVGDWAVDQSGAIWICTAAGGPGTWVSAAAGGAFLPLAGGDLTGPVSSSTDAVFHLDSYTGTDDQKMASALAAAVTVGGGTIRLAARVHTFANQWATTYAGGTFCNLRISGQGAAPHGQSEAVPAGVTIAVMTYAGAGAARMDFQQSGSIEIDHILFKDNTGSTVPFFQTTNAQPYIHDCAFMGNQTNLSCNQDAIYFGGIGSITTGGGDSAPFQAYQGVVERCSFYGIRTACWARTYANSVSMRDLLIDGTCGSANILAVTDGAMTAASPTLTCATSTPFTSGMVGQVVIVAGAGLANCGGYLLAYITAYTSSSVVTLSCNAVATVTAATVTAPGQSPFMIGTMNATSGGVEGCLIDGCCIELSHYTLGVLFMASVGNAVMGSAMWDGGVGISLISVGCVNGSSRNTIMIPENNMPAGSTAYATDIVSTSTGTDLVFSPTTTGQFIQMPTFGVNGSHQLNMFGTGAAAGNSIAFGPLGGPATAWIYEDAASNLTLLSNAGAYYVKMLGGYGAWMGSSAAYMTIGNLGTANCYMEAAGSGGSADIIIKAQTAARNIQVQSHLTASPGVAPGIAANAAAGSGPTVSVAGNDQRGTITITTGTSPTAGDLATITYTNAWTLTTPVVTVSGDGTTAALALAAAALLPCTALRSTTLFHLAVPGTPAASTTYLFNYTAMG
jgi:hypothetical protein